MIHLFIYQGANNGERPNSTATYYGVEWTVSTQGHLRTVIDAATALNLLLTYTVITTENPGNQIEQDELDIFNLELTRQKRIQYLQASIAAYQNEVSNLPNDVDPSEIQRLTDLIAGNQTELNELLG